MYVDYKITRAVTEGDNTTITFRVYEGDYQPPDNTYERTQLLLADTIVVPSALYNEWLPDLNARLAEIAQQYGYTLIPEQT